MTTADCSDAGGVPVSEMVKAAPPHHYVLTVDHGKAFVVKLLRAGIAHTYSRGQDGWTVHVRERHDEALRLYYVLRYFLVWKGLSA